MSKKKLITRQVYEAEQKRVLRARKKKGQELADIAALHYLADLLMDGFFEIECAKDNHAGKFCSKCQNEKYLE